MKCPCKGCTERRLTCHGFCEKYGEWKKEREAINEYNRTMNRATISEKRIRNYWQSKRYGRQSRSNISTEDRR